MNYRFDKRSEDEFKKHIKECSLFEHDLMKLYVDWLNTKKNIYTFSDHGIDNSGEFISDSKNVTSKADFTLHTKDKKDRRIEIKHCKPERSVFHLKTSHVRRCIKDNVCIVNWMNTDGPNRRFCILTPKILSEKLEKGPHVKMWMKDVIRFYNNEYEWFKI